MSIDKIIDGILLEEGGFVDDVHDSGGATNYGITEVVAKENGYFGPMKDLPQSVARNIYMKKYWLDLKLDQVSNFTPLVAEELCDAAVNQGPQFAKKTLQEALNLLNRNGEDYPDITEDGNIGAGTLTTLTTFLHKRGPTAEKLLLKVVVLLRGKKYIEICKTNPTQEIFFVGWITNRVHFTV